LEELNTIEEVRNKLVIKYGHSVDNMVSVSPENIEKFQSEYMELLKQNSSIKTKFPLIMFSEFNFTPEELMCLEPILTTRSSNTVSQSD
jgi:hypothetical protein